MILDRPFSCLYAQTSDTYFPCNALSGLSVSFDSIALTAFLSFNGFNLKGRRYPLHAKYMANLWLSGIEFCCPLFSGIEGHWLRLSVFLDHAALPSSNEP